MGNDGRTGKDYEHQVGAAHKCKRSRSHSIIIKTKLDSWNQIITGWI